MVFCFVGGGVLTPVGRGLDCKIRNGEGVCTKSNQRHVKATNKAHERSIQSKTLRSFLFSCFFFLVNRRAHRSHYSLSCPCLPACLPLCCCCCCVGCCRVLFLLQIVIAAALPKNTPPSKKRKKNKKKKKVNVYILLTRPLDFNSSTDARTHTHAPSLLPPFPRLPSSYPFLHPLARMGRERGVI